MRRWIMAGACVAAVVAIAVVTRSTAALVPVAPGAGGDREDPGAAPSAIPLPSGSPRATRLARAAESQVGTTTTYDPSYVVLEYPGGDVPLDRGVCTDVVVRALREQGIDLQSEVHEDMSRDFAAYPKRWGLTKPDPNIDHRRVPNLQTYFTRRGARRPITRKGRDYLPGDVVSWDLSGRPHIGIVSTRPVSGETRYAIAHNIGGGVRVEDALFAYPITGHYRLF